MGDACMRFGIEMEFAWGGECASPNAECVSRILQQSSVALAALWGWGRGRAAAWLTCVF